MSGDAISSEELSRVRQLGYKGVPNYCKVFDWFRQNWKYVSWIEKNNNEYVYKIYARGVYHRPIHSETKFPYCKTYEEARVKLLDELIIIVEEIE